MPPISYLQDAEAAEVLQFMQSMDPEHADAGMAGNNTAIARTASVPLEKAMAADPTPLAQVQKGGGPWALVVVIVQRLRVISQLCIGHVLLVCLQCTTCLSAQLL